MRTAGDEDCQYVVCPVHNSVDFIKIFVIAKRQTTVPTPVYLTKLHHMGIDKVETLSSVKSPFIPSTKTIVKK